MGSRKVKPVTESPGSLELSPGFLALPPKLACSPTFANSVSESLRTHLLELTVRAKCSSPDARAENWSILTVPSGKIARISSSPPIARTNDRSVLTYISVRFSILETDACVICRSEARCVCVIFRADLNSSSGISAIICSAANRFAPLRSGDIVARRVSHFLAIIPLRKVRFRRAANYRSSSASSRRCCS